MGTSRRNRRGQSEYDPVGLAGWLYTDLLLGLMVVFLGSVTFQVVASGSDQDGSQAGSVAGTTTTSTTTTSTTTTSTTTTSTTTTSTTVAPTTTTSTTVAPTTTTTTAAVPLGVEQGFHCFRINLVLDENDQASRDASVTLLETELQLAGIDNRNAGIVITFGVSENYGIGGAIARRYNKTVLPQIPMFNTAATRGFGDGPATDTGEWLTSSGTVVSGKTDGGVLLNVYLLATADSEPQKPADSPDCG